LGTSSAMGGQLERKWQFGLSSAKLTQLINRRPLLVKRKGAEHAKAAKEI
jgi:hypothetical protein